MFFKRLSRGSRSNSYAEDSKYNDTYDNRDAPRSLTNLDSHFPGDGNRGVQLHDSPRQSTSQHNTFPPPTPTKETQRPDSSRENEKMAYRSQLPTDPYSRSGNGAANRGSMHIDRDFKQESAPDLLTRAFNEAVRPYTDKIEALENQLADLQSYCDTLERERNEMHAWIDKRGLRPDVPAAIATQMDSLPNAATSLNAQLDRKITIVNFDLHRLQDDLNSSISTSHFSASMSKFLPDIARLTSLPGGPKLSFDLVLKLGGNLNSHGGLDSQDPQDLTARRNFYAQLDTAMVDIVRRRFEEEGDDSQGWNVGREIKRIEKTAAYLRNFGVEPYFPRTLEAMRRESDFRGAGVGVGGAGGGGTAVPPHAASPPRYT